MMLTYKYIAKDKAGHTVKGDVEAQDKPHALMVLREKELFILKLEEKAARQPVFSSFKIFNKRKVSMDEMVLFTRQMSTMTAAGITIVESLDTLIDQVTNEWFKEVLRDIRNSVNTGASLSEAISKYSVTFSAYFVNMIKAGESSGMLDDVLERISSYMEKTNTLQKKMKAAMIYPSLVITMAFSITVLMILKVIPVFKDMFSSFHAALPVPTQVLINVSDFAVSYFWPITVLIIGAIFGLKAYVSTPNGSIVLDGFKLKLPVFGPLFKKVAVSKFTRTLSTLVKSGVPILSALEIVAKTSGNLVVEKAINSVKDSVREGESITGPMERSGVFPPLVTRMIAVGEKTGELEKMLSKIADFSDEQVDIVVDGLASLIEPLIIAFLGIVIGGIVISMFLPIFKISTLVQF
ncbi:MAG: type II secretion system F family protein [Candidatus Omnitrophota bacterium]